MIQDGSNGHSEESHRKRVLARIGSNPLTWLQHLISKTKDISPETRAHIEGLFKKLVKKNGPLKSMPDDFAEREYIRIFYRLQLMRIAEGLTTIKAGGSGHHTMTKTLAVYAAATLKFKSDTGKGRKEQGQRRAVPTAALNPSSRATDDRPTEPEPDET